MTVVVLFKGISSLAVSGALFRNMQVRQAARHARRSCSARTLTPWSCLSWCS